MTGASADVVDHEGDHLEVNSDEESSYLSPLPSWVAQQCPTFGEELLVAEWQHDDGTYRSKQGWKGRDLVHDRASPVRVLNYYVKYGDGKDLGLPLGGVGTTLTGVTHFTNRAESHAGYCHGGSMCSLLDDVIGWVAFLVTGRCIPWSGFTVQVNTNLKRPIKVDSILLVKATITQVVRRKVSVAATILDPADEEPLVHASGEGLVILNRGILPEEPTSES